MLIPRVETSRHGWNSGKLNSEVMKKTTSDFKGISKVVKVGHLGIHQIITFQNESILEPTSKHVRKLS